MKFDKFLDDFQEELERNDFDCEIVSQDVLKLYMEENTHEFPMICFESTLDSYFDVCFDDSKFLNDEFYLNTWVVVKTGSFPVHVICLNEENNDLKIKVFETNKIIRGEGMSKHVLHLIEKTSKKYYKRIRTVPFDMSAENFWKHIGYKNYENIELVKEIR